ncbi:hypothetical protein IFR05_011278 [Cadophora sp. M221]|nr:hypothetical protein IFR05_011278 [Cadophora sp. M221]
MIGRSNLFLSLVALFGLVSASATFPRRVLNRDLETVLTYDYVVFGGGLSGLVVASRLTEDLVLLIEAGGL